jgi:hypothetical protein
MTYADHELSMREKIIAITMLVVLWAALAVPVSQAAWNRELELQHRELMEQSRLIDEESRVTAVQLAQAQIPEQTLKMSVLQGLSLEKIVIDQAKIVVIE